MYAWKQRMQLPASLQYSMGPDCLQALLPVLLLLLPLHLWQQAL
jgi:hypothetical protein